MIVLLKRSGIGGYGMFILRLQPMKPPTLTGLILRITSAGDRPTRPLDWFGYCHLTISHSALALHGIRIMRILLCVPLSTSERLLAMASFDIAARANLATVLPGLLTALHIQREQPSLLPTVSKNLHDVPTLRGEETIQMTSRDGSIWSGKAVVRYLTQLSSNNDNNIVLQTESPVRIAFAVDCQIC